MLAAKAPRRDRLNTESAQERSARLQDMSMRDDLKWRNLKVKTVDKFSVPNFTIRYPYLAYIACLKKIKGKLPQVCTIHAWGARN